MAGDYAPLWCKSNYSFLEGASHPEELIETAANLGLPAVALADRDGVYGTVEAHVKARELGVKLILGSEVTLDDDSTITLLATNRGGWKNLCRLITHGRRRSEKGESMLDAGILPGDLVIVRKQAHADSGQIVVALVDDEATIKTLRKRRNRIELHPANPRYPILLPDPHEVRILGKVIEVRRTLDN